MFACTRCSTANRDGARFCDACGASLAASPPAPDELKYVTVLFSDIVGSTAMIAGLPPDEARLRFTPALEVMAGAVQAFGGMVNQFLGDGLMAFFGAPLSQEDHALQACCAAMRMHEDAARLAQPAQLRIGLASGATLLSAGGDAAGAYMAFGATIHLASRLQVKAEPGQTLCAAETARLAGPAVTLIAHGAPNLRGLPAGQEVFGVTAIRPDAPRFGGALARGLSPHINRTRELAILEAAAAAVRQGTAGAVMLEGEAGVGKSRLAWEFARTLTTAEPRTGWQVLQAEAVSYGRSVPYRLISVLLRACFGTQEPESRIGFELGQGAPPLARPALLSLLNLPLGAEEASWEGLDPQQRRGALQDAVCHLVHSLAARRPLLLLMEDLHWADAESLRLLDLAATGPHRTLLLGTYRTDFDPDWTRLAPVRLVLGPLSADETDRLIRGAFPAFDPGLRQRLAVRAAGNPFFTEEIARAAAEESLDAHGPTQTTVPSSIQAVLAARIDRLPTTDRHLLRAASTLGNRFSRAGLEAMASNRLPAAFDEQMARLRKAGLLRPSPHDDTEETFAHALIQEVAYQALPASRRHALHAEALLALKAIDAERIPEHAETLAYHAFRGEVWDEAVLHARRAGRRAASRSAYVDAAAFFEQAITALEHLPPSDGNLEQGIDLRFELRNALFPTSRISHNLGHSQAAEKLALQLGDRRRLGWATAFHARDLTLMGRPVEAVAVAGRALGVAGHDDELLVVTTSYLGLASYSLGDYAHAASILRDLVARVEAGDRMSRYGLPGPATVFFRGWLAWALARTGDHAEADAVATGMMARAEEVGQPLALTVAHLSRGFALAYAGRLEEARDALQQSLALCRKWEFFAWFTNIAACLGHVLARLGNTAEGIDLLQQAVDRTRASGILVSHANELAWLSEAHRIAGNPDEAHRHATEALAIARSHGERGNEAMAAFALASALVALHRPEEAAALLRVAQCLAESCGLAPLAGAAASALAETAPTIPA